MKKRTATAIAIATFVVGGLAGFSISYATLRAKLTVYEVADVDQMSTYLLVQRFQGTPQAYEAAVRDYLAALEVRERAGPGLLSNVAPVDKALAYSRLALIAAERNDLASAAKYRAQAEAECPKIGWKSCSADEIATVVRRIDEQIGWNSKPHSVPDHGS
jgi:hypothetical protein